MSVTDFRSTSAATLAELVSSLGDIPLERIRCQPSPGTATEADVLRAEPEHGRLCELVDGVLVDKAMGFREAMLAPALVHWLRKFVVPQNLGIVTGADGAIRLLLGNVRIPDVAFISWARLPGGHIPTEPLPLLAPDLAIEVLSPSNTVAEMQRKRDEYFQAGVRQVWIIDPISRRISVFSSVVETREFGEGETLTGGDVLPGFVLDVSRLFAELVRQGNP